MPDMFDSKLPVDGQDPSVERSDPTAELVAKRFLAVERSTGDSGTHRHRREPICGRIALLPLNFTMDKFLIVGIDHCTYLESL